MIKGGGHTSRASDESAGRPSRALLARIALFLASVIVFLFIADLAVRVAGLGPKSYDPPRYEPATGVPFTQIQGGPLVYQGGTSFASVYDPAGDARNYFGSSGRIEYRINNLGLRGPDITMAKPPDTVRIVCLGDSFTFGEGVRENDTYPAKLAGSLGFSMSPRRVEVINAGVQTYDTKDAAALYLMRLEKLKPDVVLLGFFLNDPTDSRETVRQHEAQSRALPLSGLGRMSKLWEMIERGRAARALQAEYFQTTRNGFASPKWEECKQVITGLQQIAHEDGFRFVVVVFPILWDLDATYPFEDLHAQVGKACADAGCQCIDLLGVFRGRPAESLWVHPTDHHPNELAHQLAAERIAKEFSPSTVKP